MPGKYGMDLSSLDAVEQFAKKLNALNRLNALIENAGIALDQFGLADGMETSVTVNVAATMLLAIGAMPKLQESAKRFGIKPHLVVVASMTAFDMKGVVEGIEGDIFNALSQETSNMAIRYPLTKLLQIYATRQPASLFPEPEAGVVTNALNPRVCVTELSRNAGWIAWLQVGLMRRLLGRTAEQGSRTLLHAAVAGSEIHGKYVSGCEIKEYAVPEWIQDESGLLSQRRVWRDLVKALNTRGCKVTI